jgi:hypothetical protein
MRRDVSHSAARIAAARVDAARDGALDAPQR